MSGKTKKRKSHISVDEDVGGTKRFRNSNDQDVNLLSQENVAGKIKKIVLCNFLCHDHLIMEFNKNVNFIVGRNGSGKSAILTAITVGLGARASATQRGDSFKSFIKNGRHSFTIEITLTNEGLKAYESHIYGKEIKIIRTVSQTSSTIVIKGQRDVIVSRKKSDITKITSAFNIQVENPISILNQQASKTFLISPKPENLYEFFIKGTQLEIIGNNYKEALEVSKATQEKMEETKEELENDKKEIDEIEGNIKAMEGLESVREEYQALQCEYHWARVNVQEKQLDSVEQLLDQRERIVEELLNVNENHSSKSEEIKVEIENLLGRIKKLEEEASESCKIRDQIKKKFEDKKEKLVSKVREYKASKAAIKYTQKNITALTEEIKRLEEVSGIADQERTQLRQRLNKLEEDLRDVEGMIHTTLLHQSHIDSDKLHLEKKEREDKGNVNRKELKLSKLKMQLNNLSQQADNSLTVFGRNMPRLVKRIDEEYKKGRFQKKPRGPIGASIKMKDSSWTPTIESFLGNTLFSFCVDNSKDAKYLGMIIQEVYHGETSPDIICSKFIDKIHDVRCNATRTDRYSNILDVMEISDPVIANCLIDQRSPESILLIPTSDEAIALLQNIENVPQNCKRALTKKGDTFYPDPNYRTYGGYVHSNARYLQVSTTEVIETLKQEITNAEIDLRDSKQQLNVIRQKLSNSIHESQGLMAKITQLRSMQTKLTATAEELRDKITDELVADDRAYFLNRKAEDEKKLDQEKIDEERISSEVNNLHQEMRDIEIELNRYRQAANGVDEKINPIRIHIRKLEEEKNQCQIHVHEADKKIQDARQAVQKAQAQVETEKRVMLIYLSEAEKFSSRIQTQRSPEQIKKLVNEKKHRIDMVERQYGSKENLQRQLEVKRKKYNNVEKVLTALMATNLQHLVRVENRRKEYKDMKAEMGIKVETAFRSVLALRDYRGSLKIDYDKKTLNLEVIPQNTKQREKNQTMTLSGGERSYATVAFVLSLWECTALPFYFLDEFDVFMDKVNRRIIMEILLHHTRTHPQSQFGFLTPLDASIVKSNDFLTIHQLEAPQRAQLRKSHEE